HQGLVDGKWEVDRRRMKAVVDQALRDVERSHPATPLTTPAEHELVLAAAIVGKIEGPFEPVHQVVRVEYGVLADRGESFRAERPNVGVGTHEHAEVAVERLDLSDRVGA